MNPTIPPELEEIWPSLSAEYKFCQKLNTGQNAIPFKLTSLTTRRDFCLKLPKPDVDSAILGRRNESILKEIEILLPLNHVAVPRIYRFDLNPQRPWYISNFHPGTTFKQFAADGKSFDLQGTIHVVSSLLDVLEYLHSEGRTHCDLHDKNILISTKVIRDGLLVIDFGSGHRGTESSDKTENRGMPQLKPLDGPAYGADITRRENQRYFEQLDMRALGLLLGHTQICFLSDASKAQKSAFGAFCKRLQENSISNHSEARDELTKVFDPYRKMAFVNRLFEGSERSPSIRIPCSTGIEVGSELLQLINTSAFQKLRSIKQLSFCDWYYPGATHTRFEHSLGVMDAVRHAILSLSTQKIFRNRYSLEQLKGTLVAALMHDVGHYPFAHVLEHYAASRFGDDIEIRRMVSHVTKSKSILQTDPEIAIALEALGGASVLDQTFAVLDGKLGVLSDLLDGPIDCDKLDYLVRDSHHCGLKFGNGIDKYEFLKRLRCVGNCDKLGVDITAVAAVEGFMILQDQMLTSVYWHEFSRGIICMFHAAIAHLVKLNKEDFKTLVARIQTCGSEQEALVKVIMPAAKKLEVTEPDAANAVSRLIEMHMSPKSSGIYRPIASYRQSDAAQEDQLQTVYQKLSPRPTSSQSSTSAVNWKCVAALRKCYLDGFKKHEIGANEHELIVDVPIGKAANRIVSMLQHNGMVVDITDESHLSRSIFDQPAIFASPIRVFIAPELYERVKDHIVEIVMAAENEFLSQKDMKENKPISVPNLARRLLSYESSNKNKRGS